MKPYDAVLCDLDGVLRIYDPDGLASEGDFGLERGTVRAVAFEPELMNRAVTGEITDDQWQEVIAERLTVLCGSAESATALVQTFVAAPYWVDAPVLELLTEARRHVPVALVTNATTRLERDLARAGLLNAFDAIVNSSALGGAKPDRRIFEIAAEQVGAEIDRCLFIDDHPSNVQAAEALGMAGVLYREPRDLGRALMALLDDDHSSSSS
ncbi:HAD family hydrolase [Planotetraspora kaengkrachanensis]|uniref:Haloacid dehalogenase n=1 Tax=Planotetraspora kaengkrachanensis TaxID=575193 RepID=A0A8J3M0S3_9ACTN|nr:HAD-IA family hydrolase [Planotetraspora kaengkrachanensis]GIG79963.1 haloacid dehalogenase [Planotetraspora kaengkrachanensis]